VIELDCERCVVIDASDSIILAHEKAMAAWLKLAQPGQRTAPARSLCAVQEAGKQR
jgi:hypothetical protein